MLSSITSSTTDPEPAYAPAGEAGSLPLRWTADHVGLRLVEAMRTLDRMPRPKGPRGAGNHWPRHRVEWADRLAQAELPEDERRARAAQHLASSLRPGGAEIARMDHALEWIREIRTGDPEMAMLLALWALRTARRRSLRALCQELGLTPPTFYKRRAQGLARLAGALEGRGAAVF